MPFLFLFFTFSCSEKKNVSEKIFIEKVYDGDTFFDPKHNSYRLFGVDTPEINYYDGLNTSQGLEFIYAQKAKTYVEKLILNKEVYVEKIKKDKYERMVSKIKVNNEDLAFLLVKEGLARVAYISLEPKSPFYTDDFNYYQDLLNYQYLAYKQEKGFWTKKDSFKEIFPKS